MASALDCNVARLCTTDVAEASAMHPAIVIEIHHNDKMLMLPR
jgi:hypothetical protein